MFGLLSDLDECIWADSPTKPPADKKQMDGGGKYEPWGICQVQKESDHMKLFLTSNSGAPCQGLLFGARRNPLKDVGHCWMTFENKEPGPVITGIAIEDDWVIMKHEYLCTFADASLCPKKKEADLKRQETIDMGIYGDLVHDKWDKKGKPPRGKGQLGYHYCEVLRTEEVCHGEFKVCLGSEKGDSFSANIIHSQRNPFHAITKGYFKIVDGIIKGVMVEDDWVELYK